MAPYLAFLLGGPVGALFGIFIGHCFDQGLRKNWHLYTAGIYKGQRKQTQQIFFTSTFLVMGHLAKCDGHVSEHDIQAARFVMDRMGLDAAQRRHAITLFSEGKQTDFAIDPVLRQLRDSCHGNRQLLQLFINLQLQAAYADSKLSTRERELLQHISVQLGFTSINYAQFEEFYQNSRQRSQRQHQYRQRYQQHYSKTGTSAQGISLQSAYDVLGVSVRASDAEVKRAYRRQMNKNHPDKLVSKGLPAEMIKLANEKTQEIKQAYDMIKQARR